MENCNVNAEAKECSGGDDVRKQADAPPEQSKREKTRGRKIAYFSEFCGCGDKECHPSSENRNMGIYCGKNEFLSANVRGSPQSAAKNSIHNSNSNSNKYSLTYKLYQL